MNKILLTLLLTLTLNAGESMKKHFYDFEATNIKGKTVSMSSYKGKVVLVVNVASECGFTPQYEGLEKLYESYQDKDFMILGFPCNQFSEQESGSNEEIKFFCESTYDVDFDMFAKIDVNGDNTTPLYNYLKSEATGFLWTESIKWNFTKFLVDKDGNVITRYGSSTTPSSIEEDIKKLL